MLLDTTSWYASPCSYRSRPKAYGMFFTFMRPTSHRPDVEHLDDEEEEDAMQ
jgi:hypothetical protein